MGDPRELAVMAVRQHLIDNGCTVPLDVIRGVLEAAEKVWPHESPKRDPASAIAGSFTIRSAMDQPTGFGFGQPAAVTGETP